jgi:hypothetical protein
MAHTIQEKKKLLNRVCKIMGQIAEAKEVATLPPPQTSDITRYRSAFRFSSRHLTITLALQIKFPNHWIEGLLN